MDAVEAVLVLAAQEHTLAPLVPVGCHPTVKGQWLGWGPSADGGNRHVPMLQGGHGSSHRVVVRTVFAAYQNHVYFNQ